MTSPCISCEAATICRAAQQPYGIEDTTADGVFIKQMAIPVAGTLVPQHSHTYDHTSLLAAGSVRVFKEGSHIGDFRAPKPIVIPAHTKHSFLSLEDNTVIYCIHNVSRQSGQVEIAEEHNIIGD